MPVGNYDRSGFYNDIGVYAASHPNAARLANRAVREVISRVDLRTQKRRANLAPQLNEELFDYQSPTDLKERAIVDIRLMSHDAREKKDKFNLVSAEYFDRNKTFNKNLVAIEDADFFQKLRISADLDVSDKETVLHAMETTSVTGGATFSLSASASNLTLDKDNFIEGEASVNFDVAASYVSASLVVSGITSIDISDYERGGSVYAYIWIPDTSGLNAIVLRVGDDSSNYFRQQVTTTNEGLAFRTGWNLIRMDFASATEVGSVDMDTINYLLVGLRGDGTASATTDWRVDYIVARRGEPHWVYYYTKYGWQNSGGTSYLENSTADTDRLNADTEEYQLFIMYGKYLFAEDLKMFDESDKYLQRYLVLEKNYTDKYPSERLLTIEEYHSFSSDLTDDYWLNN